MGLAPYGEPRFAAKILEHLLDLKPDGSFRLNLDYFEIHLHGQAMTNDRFGRLFEVGRREPDQPLQQEHCDLAQSIQGEEVAEEIILRLARTHCRRKPVRKEISAWREASR